MNDQLGNTLLIGDRARVTAIDAGRGAYSDRVGACTIIAIKRTRAEVKCDGFIGTNAIGPELLRVTEAIDGRRLLTFADVNVFGIGLLKPCESYPRKSALGKVGRARRIP
jgi:hypothetical protein